GTLLGIFMMADSSTDGGMVGFLQADVWTSFLHRSILVAIVSIAVMISVSLATSPPPVARTEGVCYEWGRPDPERGRGISDYRVWAGILFVLVMTLWVVFR
ncbi:MAG: hypothetical protein KC940_17085, partial [Candidatus Omnitrophica bacterium]|nr:hypothetical protein [Candidatus Omnitrophota bacterium]